PLFLFTPDRPGSRVAAPVRAGISQLVAGVKALVQNHPKGALFLLARLLYTDGLRAVFFFGGIYSPSVFNFGWFELGLFGIILTIAGTLGAALGGLLDDRQGSRRVVSWTLALFILASIGVLSVDHTRILFVLPVEPKIPGSKPFSSTGEQVYLVFAILIGLASGPLGASSRTLLARLTPQEKISVFFAFSSSPGKTPAFPAPPAIGAVPAATNSQRLGIATSLVFLISGLLVLQRVKDP